MKTLALATATIGLVLTSAPALAGEGAYRTHEISVAGLDLDTPEGQALLDQRVERAAREVCGFNEQRVGTRIRSGWTRQVRERLGKAQGCTHLTRLLEELAVVAAQTVWPLRRQTRPAADAEAARQPPFIDTCHALRSDGPVVREHYPRWYRAPS